MGYFIKKQYSTFFLKAFLCLFFVQSLMVFPMGSAYAFSHKDEVELGKKFNVLIRSRLPIVHDPEVVLYINDLIARLSKNIPPQPFSFTPAVVASPSLNAFATPGGYVFAFTGLILAMDTEDELAAVMAHEIAHVTERHVAKRIEDSQVISLLSLVGMLAGALMGGDAGSAAAIGGMAASQSAMLSYSRADENEADMMGMKYLIDAGYDPYGMPRAFEVLSRRQWIMGASIPTYLSTHPALKDRIHTTTVRLERNTQSKMRPVDNNRFKRIQTLLRAYYSDPATALQYFKKQTSGENAGLAHMGLGILASRGNRVAEAVAAFDKALATSPNDQLIMREAGRFHYLKGNKQKATEYLSKAVAMNKKDIMGLFFLARSQADRGQLHEAITNLNYILRFVPEDSEIHFFLARYHGQQKNLFDANLHMAYSALYENNKKNVVKFLDGAKQYATTAHEAKLERFEKIYSERKEFW